MNGFLSTENGSGILKDYTGDTPVSDALSRKRKELSAKIIVPTKEEVEGSKDED